MKKIIGRIIQCCLACFIVLFISGSLSAEAKSNQYNAVLDTIEEATLNEIVFDKLGVNAFEYEVISGMSSVNRYILVEGNNCYLIYDRKLMGYIEYSTSTNSIYHWAEENIEKVYLAPTYYFKLKDNKIIDLISEEELTSTQIEYFVSMEEELYLSFVESRQNAELSAESGNVIMNTAPSEPTSITHSYYFEELADNMGTNRYDLFSGSCSYVAIGMILSYYDSIINDNVIEESYDVEETKYFSSYSSINTNSYIESPGIDDTFHADIIALGRKNGYTGSDEVSISLTEMDNLLADYFADRDISITTHNTNSSTSKINFCIEAINSDNPVIIQIIGTDIAIDDRDLNHAVVGYGYDDSGIYVNFGWKGKHTNVNINNYSIPRAFYMELNEEHLCSNNYLWNYDGCSGTVCSCDAKMCNHERKTFNNYDYTYHKNQCVACGNYTLEAHNFYISDGYDICSDCGYQVEVNHTHAYIYRANGDGRTHTAICSCGNLKRETCFGRVFVTGEAYCIKCGQKMIGGGLFSLNSTDEICGVDEIRWVIINK